MTRTVRKVAKVSSSTMFIVKLIVFVWFCYGVFQVGTTLHSAYQEGTLNDGSTVDAIVEGLDKTFFSPPSAGIHFLAGLGIGGIAFIVILLLIVFVYVLGRKKQ